MILGLAQRGKQHQQAVEGVAEHIEKARARNQRQPADARENQPAEKEARFIGRPA